LKRLHGFTYFNRFMRGGESVRRSGGGKAREGGGEVTMEGSVGPLEKCGRSVLSSVLWKALEL